MLSLDPSLCGVEGIIYKTEYRSENARVCGSQSPGAFHSFDGSKSMAITLIVQFLVGVSPCRSGPCSSGFQRTMGHKSTAVAAKSREVPAT